ncbi:MlaD family protein [Lapillicoccus sp.]|uniref:MCE family protein n=1 Tax=Lapillicoccus sp. TaxID=1909287 RepID=UPI0025DEC842|nr:MlaD family protein [Lapillicoccus sp.]
MLGRKVIVQVALFLVVALVGTAVIAIRYVQVPRLIGASGYTVVMSMPDTGGAYTDAEVTYRGVSVGQVGAIRLTGSGVEADLDITSEAPPIPADLVAVVANRSAIGEQYVDLRPKSDSGPFLAAGSHVAVAASDLPIDINTLLLHVDGFVQSVPQDSLRTVVDELGNATKGSGENIQVLVDAGRAFTKAASDNFPATQGLINNSVTVLATQQGSSDNIKSFSSSLQLVAKQLQSSDGDLRTLIAAAPGAATELNALITEVGVPLGVLMGNLLTTAQVFSANSAGLQGVYVRVPQAISAGYNIIGPDGLKVGLVTTFFDPLPCTSGYGGTALRPPTDTSAGQPLNQQARCTAPASSGTDVRGIGPALAASTAAGTLGAGGTGAQTIINPVSSLADLMGGQG